MGNKKNRFYAILLIIATLLFIIGMVKCIFSLKFTGNIINVTSNTSSNFGPASERLSDLDDYVLRHGPDVIYNELYYGHNYEPEFDEYWEFADIQVAALRGRFADDNSADKARIQEYIANCNDDKKKEAAERYLELMK